MIKDTEQLVKILKSLHPYIKEKYNVDSLELFGSYSRNEATDNSDIDILITFTKAPSLLKYIELENFLSGKLEAKADLVMKKALKKNLRAKVISEAIYIA